MGDSCCQTDDREPQTGEHAAQSYQWKMLVFVAFVQLVYFSASVPQMSLVRKWESVDVLVPGKGGQGTSQIPLFRYDNAYNFMIDSWLLDVNNDRLFVALGQTRAPYSLAYHNHLLDTSKSLLLQPYPSWDAHSDEHGDQQIHEVVALRADRCNRLWVIDRVTDDDHRIIVFDLNTDRILRKHTFWHSILFMLPYSMVVDDDDCENPYLYINDSEQGGIWTYSWAQNTLWHHPGDLVTGMVIALNKNAYSTIYFNKDDYERSRVVWYISTRYLRYKTSNMLEFEHRRGRDVYLSWAALDAKSNVLFACIFNKSIRAYPCWNGYESCVPSEWHDIAINTTHEVVHLIPDKNGNLWALTRNKVINQINLSIFSLAITSAKVELNKTDKTNTTKLQLNETASPATDPASSTTVQSGVVYINNTTVTTKETTAGTPNSNITATDPASSTTGQSGVVYIINNTTVTTEETTAGTPNSNITATSPASSTTEQASRRVDYDGISDIHYWDYWRYYMQWERRTTISPHRPSAATK